MTQQTDLFRDLSHRLCDFAEAAVLLALLSNHADVTEYKTTSVKMSLDRLEGMVPRLGVQRALKRLKARGLINIRIQPNTATLVRVDREAVLALLRKPMPDHIPGNDDYHFPFLDAWAADKAAKSSRSAASGVRWRSTAKRPTTSASTCAKARVCW